MKWTSRLSLAALCLVSSLLIPTTARALGLGEARVESYLHQPLQARIRLISRSEAELATVTASLASAADYQVIGLDRATLSVPMTFEVVADLQDPHIRVRSQLPMTEPVVQLVLEVVWASGRMLRQYTLFLDPPTIDAAAPLPGVSRAPAQPTSPQPLAEPQEQPAPAEDTAAQSEETARAAVMAPVQGGVDADSYGPVRRGETLWGIATRVARERGYSVNQLMLAIQQQNPGAFSRGNINSLKAGSVLRMPSRDEVLALGQREAMLEVQRQEAVWRSGFPGGSPAPSDELPVVADIISADSGADGEANPLTRSADALADGGRLELVPPASGEAVDGEIGTGNTASENEEGAVSVVEELARTQEELANANQENQYLNERIEELEAELARREQPATDSGLIEDTGLAELEQRLQEERRAGDDDEVQVIPPQEERPWLARWTPWVLGLVLLAIVAVVWWLRRQRADDLTVQDLTDEAEDILRVLGDEGGDDEPATESHVTDVERYTATPSQHADEEAVELDADDPETKLDLARAYLSMGDAGAARRILDEVLASGDAGQIAEARRMLQEL